jgi:hypothetical protein
MDTTLERYAGFVVLHVDGLYTYLDALALPMKMQGQHGIDDWVLPSIKKLLALQKASGRQSGWHWSSRIFTRDESSAWAVNLNDADIKQCFYGFTGLHNVRLVRATQRLDLI